MNTTSTNIPRWTYAFLAAAVAISLVSLFYRHRVEHRNTAVAMAVEGEVVESLGAAQGLAFKDSLRALRAMGFNAVVLSEQTVGELVGSGQAAIVADPTKSSSAPLILVANPRTEERIRRGLNLRLPSVRITGSGGGYVLSGAGPTLIRTVAVGINPDQAKAATDLGLTIVARCANPDGATTECVTGTLAWAHELGATIFLPMGDQVLGRRDAVRPFIDELQSLHMLYASPEFGKIGGDTEVLEKAPDLVVRLQSAQAVEIDKMTQAETVERYVLAGRERDVRVLLVRPLSLSGPAPLGALGDLGAAIQRELVKEGGKLKPPHAYTDPNVPKPVFVLLAVAIAGVALGVLFAFISQQPVRVASAIVFLLIALGSWSHPVRPFAALLAAIAFPTLGLLLLDRPGAKAILAEYALISGISVAGGMAVAGMLNALPYFVRADQFFGVKAAQFTPIALVALYFFWRLCEMRGLGKNPVLWGQILLGVLIAGALAIMWMRSGNDNPAAVSGFELKFRSLLDRILVVRPRTKEFLLGNPLMIVGIGLLLRSRIAGFPKPSNGGWIALAIVGGAIGQTSIVNTMCHLHTPLEVGLTRILVGLILGGILGLVLWAFIQRVTPKLEG